MSDKSLRGTNEKLGHCAEANVLGSRIELPDPRERAAKQALLLGASRFGEAGSPKGNDKEGFATQEEGAKLCPEAHLLTILGQMPAGANQPARAEEALRRAIGMDASLPDAHYRLALLMHADGPSQDAHAEMELFDRAKDRENYNMIQAIR